MSMMKAAHATCREWLLSFLYARNKAMADVFLSYCRRNKKVMQRLKKDLQNKGIRIWTDEGLTPDTPDWKKAIAKEVKEAKCLVVLMSPEANKSEWVGIELGYAKTHKVPIIPILISGDEEESVPIELINYHYADIRSNYTEKISEVAATIFSHKGAFTRADWGSLSQVTASSQIRPKTGTFSRQFTSTNDGSDKLYRAKKLEIEKKLELIWTKRSEINKKVQVIFKNSSILTVGETAVFYDTTGRDYQVKGIYANISLPKENIFKSDVYSIGGVRSTLLTRKWVLGPEGRLSYTWVSPLDFSSISDELISANRIMGLSLKDIQIKLDISSLQK